MDWTAIRGAGSRGTRLTPQQLLEPAVEAVTTACRVTLAARAGFRDVEAAVKADRSPVCIADWASQALIAERLARVSKLPLLGEEDDAVLLAPDAAAMRARIVELLRPHWPAVDEARLLARLAERAGPAERYWTLDPVDGTAGFLRNGHWAVALALIEDGRVELGVLGCPRLGEDGAQVADGGGVVLHALRGGGAYQRAVHGGDPLAVRCRSPGAGPLVASAAIDSSHSDLAAGARVLDRVDPAHRLLQLDSQCKYALVARGDADCYLRVPAQPDYREHIWDHAAGALLVEAGGGRVTDLDGRALDWSMGARLTANRGILAAAAHRHEELLAAIATEGA